MIEDGYGQLSDDNQDYEEVETIGKMAAKRSRVKRANTIGAVSSSLMRSPAIGQ